LRPRTCILPPPSSCRKRKWRRRSLLLPGVTGGVPLRFSNYLTGRAGGKDDRFLADAAAKRCRCHLPRGLGSGPPCPVGAHGHAPVIAGRGTAPVPALSARAVPCRGAQPPARLLRVRPGRAAVITPNQSPPAGRGSDTRATSPLAFLPRTCILTLLSRVRHGVYDSNSRHAAGFSPRC